MGIQVEEAASQEAVAVVTTTTRTIVAEVATITCHIAKLSARVVRQALETKAFIRIWEDKVAEADAVEWERIAAITWEEASMVVMVAMTFQVAIEEAEEVAEEVSQVDKTVAI